MPNHSDSPLHRRVLIAAFEGWSDAGSATTTVLQHLGGLLNAEVIHAIGADGFVDYQVHRPRVSFTESGERVLEWPETRLYGPVERPGSPEAAPHDDSLPTSDAAPAASATATPDGKRGSGSETVRRINGAPVSDLFLLAGVEPSRDWMTYADEIIDLVETWGFDTVIILGSLFSDAPHSRPIAISMHSESPVVRASTGATRSDYTGPVGITSVLDIALTTAGVNVLSLWAQVPHYVHSAPSPKATLALLDRLEELLDVVIPRGELLSEATEWEANIDRIAAADEDMARYIRALEVARDATNAPEATGEAIAHEFEKFLNPDAHRLGDFGHDPLASDSSDASGTESADPNPDTASAARAAHAEGLDDTERSDTLHPEAEQPGIEAHDSGNENEN